MSYKKIPKTHFQKKIFSFILMSIFMFGIFSNLSIGSIQDSKHDFSGQSWNVSGEICLPCHAAHNADTGLETPLWNHSTSTATYTLYSSPTLDVSPEQPRAPSLVCLSCHDGTIAMDSFGGASGDTMITGNPLIGIDLSDDHPVSISWKHQNKIKDCYACHNMHGSNPDEVPFFGGYVECSSCHDVHNDANNPKLLRQSMQGSALCLHCHQK